MPQNKVSRNECKLHDDIGAPVFGLVLGHWVIGVNYFLVFNRPICIRFLSQPKEPWLMCLESHSPILVSQIAYDAGLVLRADGGVSKR